MRVSSRLRGPCRAPGVQGTARSGALLCYRSLRSLHGLRPSTPPPLLGSLLHPLLEALCGLLGGLQLGLRRHGPLLQGGQLLLALLPRLALCLDPRGPLTLRLILCRLG